MAFLEKLSHLAYSRPHSNWIQYGQWIVIPCLILLGLEMRFRPWVQIREAGYYTAESRPSPEHIDAVFIGVSRVERAIHTEVFDRLMSQTIGRPFHSQNLGGGKRKLAMHYFGLRNLLEKYPDKYRGCTLFVEAPYDIPEPSTWSDKLYEIGYAKLLIHELHSDDLPTVYASEPDWQEKLMLKELYLERRLDVIFYRKLICARLTEGFTDMCVHRAERFSLIAPGDILVENEEPYRLPRELAKQWAVDNLHKQANFTGWDHTVLADLEQFARAHGIRLVLFRMPMHSIFGTVYEHSTNYVTASKELIPFCQQHDIPLLHPVFTYTDSDLSDWWHLDNERCDEFTSSLTQAWLKSNAFQKSFR